MKKQPLNVRMHNGYETQRAGRRLWNREAQRYSFVVSAFAVAVFLLILIIEIFKPLMP